MKLLNLTLGALLVGLVSMPVLANGKGNTECPVGLVNDLTLDEEFGFGSQELTRCIKKRHQVKMVVQVQQACSDTLGNTSCLTSGGRAYALGNIANILDDYEVTHGMVPGRDFEVVAVLHGTGGRLALQNTLTHPNRFETDVKNLIARGVKFYFCQNTTRAYIGQGILPAGNATAELIPGMLYTTAGLTSIADFQAQGYQYIQP